MPSRIPVFYRWLLSQKRPQHRMGFTLIELLISLVVSSLVVSTLLYIVVELVSLDNQEARLDQVQLDMRRAMDYITNDLQEAVYVYDDPAQISTQLAADPNFPDGTGTVPVLAFWRIDPIEENIPDCATAFSSDVAKKGECEVLKIRQAAYTLVVYAQKENNGNSNWPGQSRIVRYQLPRYSALSTLTENSGYRDPTDSTDVNASFESWQADGTPAGSAAVLVDFVAAPNTGLARSPLSDSGSACSSYGADTGGSNFYSVVPTTATTTTNTSFFACVRNPDPDNDVTTVDRTNQDVYLFLRGAAQSASSPLDYGYSESSSLPILESQVLVKGIIDKDI